MIATTVAALCITHSSARPDSRGTVSWTLTDFDRAEFGSGGTLFAIGSAGSIDEWDTTGRRLLATFQAELGKRDTTHADCAVGNFALSSRAHVLAARFECQDHSSIQLWDYSTGQPLGTIDDGVTGQLGLAVSPDGATLATAGHGALALWNIGDRTLAAQAAVPGAASIDSIAISHNGRLVAATLDPPPVGNDHRSRVVAWRIDGRNLLSGWMIDNGDQPFGSIAFNPDDHLLAVGASRGSVLLWNTSTHHEDTRLTSAQSASVKTVAFSADGSSLAAATDDHRLLWNVQRHDNTTDSACSACTASGFRDVAFSPDGGMLAFATGRHIEIFPSGSGRMHSLSPISTTPPSTASSTPAIQLHRKKDTPNARTPSEITDLLPQALRDNSSCSSNGPDVSDSVTVTCLVPDSSPLLQGLISSTLEYRDNPDHVVLFAWKDADFAADIPSEMGDSQCRITPDASAVLCASEGLTPGQWGFDYGDVDSGLVLQTDNVYFATPENAMTFLSRIGLSP
ncbi:WD40 repeat domain-containing protein [Nocardia alni]|uniref:WD40 repeat domain-containing protein n=1 Tax=Nocardia alni TaxID=2815723 RepID=UPI001C243B7E|nr:hypothetical protein [Nocardia alni]